MPLFPGNRKQMPRRQQGMVLFTVLIFLGIMMLLGITSLNTSIFDERMAANNQEMVRAFQAAESGIAAALASNNGYYEQAMKSDNSQAKTVSRLPGGRSYYETTYEYLDGEAEALGYTAGELFEVTSKGFTDTGASATIVAGFHWEAEDEDEDKED